MIEMAVTLDDFVKKKEKVVYTKFEYTPRVNAVKPVNDELLQLNDEVLTELRKSGGRGWAKYKGWRFSLTLEGKKLVKRLMLEGKISMKPKPWWWDEV